MNPNKLFLLTIVPAAAFAVAGTAYLVGEPSPSRNSAVEESGGSVTVRLVDRDGNPAAPRDVPLITRSDAEWKIRLSPEQFKVARSHGTERAFCGVFHDNHQNGLYTCVGCGLPLFRSSSKFDSGTGWPSFFEPFADENVGIDRDSRFGMVRDEIHCVRCKTHLGHVFRDGPAPTGLRYCINSAALDFVPEKSARLETAIFGAGCFWGVEAAVRKVPGVKSTEAGYSGGAVANPTYREVCAKSTGHAEVVRVEFDPSIVSYTHLLEVFFAIHDPTTPGRQGLDIGNNYRSAIFFANPSQEAAARSLVSSLDASGKFGKKIVTQIDSAGPFYRAEDYHQNYHGVKCSM